MAVVEDDEIVYICFSCSGDYSCTCLNNMRGNVPLPLDFISLPAKIIRKSTVLYEEDTTSESDPEESYIQNKSIKTEDEGLTQELPQEVPQLTVLTKRLYSRSKKQKKVQHKAAVGKTKPCIRVSQIKLDVLKEKALQLLTEGPLTFVELMEKLDSSVKTIYKKTSKFAVPLRNFLANTKFGCISFDGLKYSYNSDGVDLRPKITKHTLVELVKSGKTCYTTYGAAANYFEFIRGKKVKCVLHAALRRNNGRNGRLYDFVADVVSAVPEGVSIKSKVFEIVTFFDASE